MMYAGFWIRVLAYILDGILANIVLSPIMFLFLPFTMGADVPAMLIGMNISALIFVCLYATWEAGFCASKLMATPGKYALGLAVVRDDGTRLPFWNGIGRHAAKALSAILLCIGFIMVAFSERKQGLHDKMAATIVVKRSCLMQEVPA